MTQREAPTNRFLPTGLCRNKRGKEDWQEQLWVNWRPFIKLISRPVMRWFEGFTFNPVIQLWSGTTSNHLGPLSLGLAWSPVERCTGKRNRGLNTPHPVDERYVIECYGMGGLLLNFARMAGPYCCTLKDLWSRFNWVSITLCTLFCLVKNWEDQNVDWHCNCTAGLITEDWSSAFRWSELKAKPSDAMAKST